MCCCYSFRCSCSCSCCFSFLCICFAESGHRALCTCLWYFAVRRQHATDPSTADSRREIPSAVLHVDWSVFGSFDSVKKVTHFQWFCGLAMIFWTGMLYPVWIHCCKRPKYDFCISQGSVPTVLRWAGQNYSRLRLVCSWCCMPKLIEVGQCFTELFAK